MFDVVRSHFTFPSFIQERPYQVRVINRLGPLPRAGYYLDVGTGKTFCATVSALYKLLDGADHVIGLMPPILLTGWKRWLESITPRPTVTLYRTPARVKGAPKLTPKQMRAQIPLDAQFTLMSLPIFKEDFEHIVRAYSGKRVVLLIDEATSVKNVESGNHQYVDTFVGATGADLLALTGTPLSTPMDGYAFCKLVAPGLYRNLRQFETIHVSERDDYENVIEWKNLPLLANNMLVNAARVLRQEALPDLPPAQLVPLYYDLDPAHLALYRKLAEEQVLELEKGGKIDATSQSALFNALQQIVVNWDHFAGNEAKVSKSLDLVDQVMAELDGRKLVIFAKYRMTNAKLVQHLQKYNAVGVYGGIPSAQQQRNLDRFRDDPDCKVAVLQPSSAGYGVDGLQRVCSDVLFLELPDVPRDFHQAAARIWRDGLASKCLIRLAVAEQTLQPARLRHLLDKDALVGQVCRNFQDLRDMLFGNNQETLELPTNYDPQHYL